MEENSKRDSIFSASNGDHRRSLNKVEIVSIRILERWDEAINTFQLWRENRVANTAREEPLRNKIRAVLYALFIMNERLFVRQLKEDAFDNIKKVALSVDVVEGDALENCFLKMNEVFDDLGLVRVDLKYQKKTLEEINRSKGFD